MTIAQSGVPGASVRFTLRRPLPQDGTTTLTATTGANGVAAVSYKLNKRNDPPGTYQIKADADKSGIVGTNSTNIVVK